MTERAKLRPSVAAELSHKLSIGEGDCEVNGWTVEGLSLAGSPWHWWAIALNHVGRTAHRQGFKTRAEAIAFAEATPHPYPLKR